MCTGDKKDGYRQRNVRQFLHILDSLEYAPGTIAVNVTWMERGSMLVKLILVCTHLSSTVYKLARYWSEIAIFSYPLAFNAPAKVFPLEFREKFDPHGHKTRIMGLPGSEDSLTIG